MDVQTSSPHSAYFSLDDALETVSQDLVYDPTTKQLCIRSQLPITQNSRQHLHHKKNADLCDSGSNKLPLKTVFNDCDSGYGGLSSESSTENGSQKSETSGPNENVDDLDLSIDSTCSTSRTVKSKLQFIQNVLNKITDNVTSSGISSSDSNSAENNATNQEDSIIETIIDDRALCLGKRPPYLPPKSDDEQRRHQAEFNEILKLAKKRELKESKLKRRILSKQIRQEEEISGAIRCWTNDILPGWPSSRALKRTRDLWWSGIPSPVRPRVWSMAIGNELKITDELFRICVERSKERIWTKQFLCRRSSNPYPSSAVPSDSALKHHRRVSSQPIHTVHQVRSKSTSRDVDALGKQLQSDCQLSNDKSANCAKSSTSVEEEEEEEEEEDEEDKNESLAYLIKLDVSRTFPQLGLFQESGPLHQSLSDILAAYAVFRPDTSYCQGMSFLAAMLLLNLDSPSDAFTAFANLLNSELLLAFYRLVPERIAAVYAFYDRQLQALLPRLATHLQAIGLTTDLFFVDQIYTLFSRCLPLEVACRAWDLYLRDGDEFIFRASLALLAMYEPVLLELECAEAAQLLAHLPEDMNSEKYFSTIATLKLVPPRLWHHSLESRPEKGSESANMTLVKKLFPF